MNLDELKEKVREEKKRFEEQDPDSPEAKRSVRGGGAALLLLAVLFGASNAVTWHFLDEIYVIFIITPPVLAVFGLWALIAGKMPR
jgi:hypothetical protein